jgi:putative hydrolase
VMDAAGREALPSLDKLRDALERRRRQASPLAKLFGRLLGLDMKLRQYQLGKKFCDAVVEAEGIEALNRVWRGPESLPTLAELEDPPNWLLRTREPVEA